MKLKEILKSKGGWIGAIIGLISSFTIIRLFIAKLFGSYSCMAGEKIGSVSCGCIEERSILCGEPSMIWMPLIMIISGFIIGYFIEKMIRR